jgi:NTE family protein
MKQHEPKTVSLVLGAGGARGFAHIGVIRWLTENGYSIRSISGASMGALIGGIYASGQLEAYTDWVLRLERKEMLRLLDPAFDRTGLFRGERLIDMLRHMVGDREIEDLPVRYTAVAMDLDSGDEVWLRQGKLFDAIRASIAIPLVFTPFAYERKKLVDGGLVNPVPIAPTLDDANELTVVVSLSGFSTSLSPAIPVVTQKRTNAQGIASLLDSLHLSFDDSMPSPGIIDIALRSMEAMQNTIARLNMAAYKPDIKIEIPRTACRLHEFWRADELIMLGHQYAAQAFAASPLHDIGASGPERRPAI